jgi:taurine dioxygenase
MTYDTIEVHPLTGALGAEIRGVDLSQPLAPSTVAEIRRAFLDHLLLVFRNQVLTLDQQKDFGRAFGTLHVHPMFGAVEGHPEVILFDKKPEDTVNVGGGWHADLTCLPEPPMAGILRVTETPAVGGDTLFANMYAAYEALSPAFQKLADGLVAIHTSAKVYGPWGKYAQSKDQTHAPAKTDGGSVSSTHPVVRTHPETGRKGLFVNRAYGIFIKGLSLEESNLLLEYLCQHAVRGDFTTRLHWENDTLAFWDNRCTQHYALNDYHGHRRTAYRVTLDGDKPV